MSNKVTVKVFVPVIHKDAILAEGIVNKEAFNAEIEKMEMSFGGEIKKDNIWWQEDGKYIKKEFEWESVIYTLSFKSQLTAIDGDPIRMKEIDITPGIYRESIDIPGTVQEIIPAAGEEKPFGCWHRFKTFVDGKEVPYIIFGNRLITFTGSFFDTEDPLIWGKSVIFEIPEGIEEIGDDAFYKCHPMQHVILPKSLKKIGKRAFYGVWTKAMKMPRNLEVIEEEAFCEAGGNANWELNLPSIKWIGDRAFALKAPEGFYHPEFNKIKLGKNLEHIGEDAFGHMMVFSMQGKFVTEDEQCLVYEHKLLKAKSFKEPQREPLFVVPEDVEEICSYAIQNRQIDKLQLPKSLKTIRTKGIETCYTACNIEVPESVELIEPDAFRGKVVLTGKTV